MRPSSPESYSCFDEQIFAAVDHGLHHHVDLAALALQLDDLAAFIDRRRRRDRAGDVLAGLQRGDRLRRMIGNRRVDVDGIDVRIGEERVVVGVARLDAEPIAARVELLPIAAADRIHFGIRMALINRDEFRAKAQTDDCHTNLPVTHSTIILDHSRRAL